MLVVIETAGGIRRHRTANDDALPSGASNSAVPVGSAASSRACQRGPFHRGELPDGP